MRGEIVVQAPGVSPGDSYGIETIVPPRERPGSYGVLVPQVDADGNDVGGVRPFNVQVPIGTYTGWALFRDDLFADEACELAGSFVPFAATKAERIAAGAPRRSLEERYPTKAAYVRAVREATDRLISEAEAGGVRAGP